MKRHHFTKQPAIVLLALLALNAVSISSDACELCAFNRNYMPLASQNSFGIVHSYRVYNGYESLQQQTKLFPDGAYRIPAGTPTVQDGGHAHAANLMAPTDFESFKVIEARARYFIHPQLEVNIHVPFVNNKQEWLGMRSRVFGLGDVSVSAGYHFLQQTDTSKFRQRGIVGLGVKMPTGNCNNQYGDGDRLPLLLRAGTGSTDATAFVSWSGAYQDWIWGATLQGKYHGENKFSEQLQPTVISTYFVTRAQYKKEWILLPQLLIHQEFTKGIQQHNYLIPGTGTNIILAGAGLETYYHKTGFSISLQLPLYQEVYYMDMKIGGHFCVGISYNFGSEKYLLH